MGWLVGMVTRWTVQSFLVAVATLALTGVAGASAATPAVVGNRQSTIVNRHFSSLQSPAPSPNLRSGSPRPALQLLAQPVLGYATYLGGAAFDIATGVAVDSTGSVYLTGYTNSLDLPASGGGLIQRGGGTCGSGLDTYPCFDIFVARLDPSGRNLVYLAILGGSGDDFATGLALDAEGNAYITGYTNSSDFPVANAAQTFPGGGVCGGAPCFDAFVAKLDSSGANLVYATYLGGSADDYAQGVAVDAAGKAVVTGFTASPDFPVAAALFGCRTGGYDAFVSKLDASGAALEFSTFLGGAGDDFGAALALDGAGQIYLTGSTNSADFPTLGGFQNAYAAGVCGALSSTVPCFDAFVAKMPADGARLEFSTFLGGTEGDYGYGIAVDAAGSAYVTGLTTSQGFPVTFGAFQTAGGGTSTDAFVSKLDPSGAALVYSTYLGGILAESGASVVVDSSGRAYVAGSTYGSGFPLVDPIQPASGGFFDAFLAVLNDAGTRLEFSTYLGGSGNEKARGLALDSLGNVYVAGETFSEDFPVARAFQSGYAGGAFDAFLVKVALGDSPVLYVSPTHLDFGEQLVGTVSSPQAVTLTNTGTTVLELSGVSVSGEFIQSNNCATSLDVNASCSIQISFRPQTTGERAGGLIVTNSSPEESRTAALAGAGTDFSIGGAHRKATVAAGETASFTLSATPAGGFHETVSLACSGAPKAASCLVSPALVSFDGSSSVPVSVTVSTRKRAAALPRGTPPAPRRFPLLLSTWLLAAILLGKNLCHLAEPRGAARARASLAMASLALLVFVWTACGGGGGAPSPSPPPEGTPPGTYTLTLTGSYDGVSRSATLQLTVR